MKKIINIKIHPILLPMVDQLDFDTMPQEWTNLEISSFSKQITIWDFQQQAIRNCIKCLYLFYHENNASKPSFYQQYIEFGLSPQIQEQISMLSSKKDNVMADYLDYYYNFHGHKSSRISFEHFINRQAFWMATGSGKSIIIIKLIQLLHILMNRNCIPRNDILLLTHREDLIIQFTRHIREFNAHQINNGFSLKLVSLKDYESEKRHRANPSINQATVFFYRSDLFRDEEKQSILDFRNYENNGKWYLILDEAHKGDKEDSKQQCIFSIMSRNGFLFNFSATFIEPSDIITTIFNHNLEKFINNGYGKHIFISNSDIRGFSRKIDNETMDFEKRITILKSLILLTYIKFCAHQIQALDTHLYHEPILLSLVNTVNFSEIKEKTSDLMIFFNELKNLAENAIEPFMLEKAKSQLINELSENELIYENTKPGFDLQMISSIEMNQIRLQVFHAEHPSAIEILCIPDNDKEIILKLKNANKAFALIKIGDARPWMMNNLQGFEITESYDYREIFKELDQKPEICLLLGSRAFYEGWDSNRPNILLFINIGKDAKSRKFITQAIGRGLRIEPIPNIRKRRTHISRKTIETIAPITRKIKKEILDSIETLYIFGTNAEILQEVINTLKFSEPDPPEAKDPQTPKTTNLFKESANIIKATNPNKYPQTKLSLSTEDLEYVKEIFNSIDSRILICMYSISLHTINSIKEAIKEQNQNHYFAITTQASKKEVFILKLISFFRK